MEAERDREAPKLCAVGARGYLRGMDIGTEQIRKDLRNLKFIRLSLVAGHEQGIFRNV